MTVPSKEAFDASISMLESTNVGYLRAAFTKEIFLDSNDLPAKRLLDVALYTRKSLFSKLNDDDALSWLRDQHAFRRVDDRCWRNTDAKRPVDISHDQRVDNYYDALRKLAESDTARGKRRFDDRLDLVLGVHRMTYVRWILRLMDAIHEYHYVDAPAMIIANRRQYYSRIKSAIVGMESLLELKKDQAIINRFQTLRPYNLVLGTDVEVSLIDEDFDARLQILRSMERTDIETMYPIYRQDETAKERLFIYRMARANHLAWRKFRPSDIAILMEIEGFRSEMSERNIQRLCADLDHHWRQLLDEIKATSVTSVKAEISETTAITDE